MLSQVIGSTLHYVSALMLFGMAITQMYLFKLAPTADVLRLTARVNRGYGIAALTVLFTGVSMVMHNGKGAAYYLHSGAFHGAITLYVLAALLSILPTRRVRGHLRALERDGTLPSVADWTAPRKFVHAQLALIVLTVVTMSMMARGVLAGG